MARSGLRSRLEVLGAAALFSTGGAAVKATTLTGWQVACFRSAVAAAALFLLLPGARRRPTPAVLGVAAAYAATMICFVQANKLTTAAATIFLQATAPLYVLLLSPWLLKERIRRADLIYMGVLGAGMALLLAGRDPASATAPNPALGNILALISGVTWAITILGLRALNRHPEDAEGKPTELGAAASLWGSLLTCTFCLPFALPATQATPTDGAIILFLGIFQIAFAYAFLNRGIVGVPAFEASLLLLLEPVLNPIWAWWIHGERPGTASLAGGAVILLATLIRSAQEAKPTPAPTPT
jgi:DME family drug/metabolite transporter